MVSMEENQRKQKSPDSDATQGGRRPTGVASEPKERGRWSSSRKTEVVLRILRGEQLDALSRELNVTAERLAEWRDHFLAGGQTALKSREADSRDEEIKRLKAKVGELTMSNELLDEKITVLEAGLGPLRRRSRP